MFGKIKKQEIDELEKRIKELGDKSTQVLIFLSFAMVSIITLENRTNICNHILYSLNISLLWLEAALIPVLLGVLPLKEICIRNHKYYVFLVMLKFFLLIIAIIFILFGIISFLIPATMHLKNMTGN